MDRVIRGAILKTGNGKRERPLHHPYQLELSSIRVEEQSKALDPSQKHSNRGKPRAAKTRAVEKIEKIITDIADTDGI